MAKDGWRFRWYMNAGKLVAYYYRIHMDQLLIEIRPVRSNGRYW